jgi:hypothetical protein
MQRRDTDQKERRKAKENERTNGQKKKKKTKIYNGDTDRKKERSVACLVLHDIFIRHEKFGKFGLPK